MKNRASFIALLLGGLLIAGLPAASAGIVPDPMRIVDAADTPDCEEFVPASYTLPIDDDGQPVSLDVYVLLDVAKGAEVAIAQRDAKLSGDRSQIKKARGEFKALVKDAKGFLDKAPSSYAPLNIELNYKKWGLLKPLDANGKARERTTDSQSIIDLSKEQFGGTRPKGFDVVYVLTDLDMTAPEIGNAVAGQADCIGGVRYKQHAFAVGEISAYENLELGPLTFYYAATSKIAAHEIGHLMGAHHHYQDCVEGIPTELDQGEVSPCTLMTNAVDFQSLNFSLIEAAVVRGHALDYALANDKKG
ncbi:MAG: hypothetical protein GEU71_10655 [Actinobacteria bacterium]|nr:hypothetical protein [Actinomycetota bacterium]